jgi:EAL domain-containing protein (putative c-di-GMP-specific phosphodiesterase class I)
MLKLDAGVTASLGEDPVAAAIVHGVASIAESLAMRLVAEGIETSQQLRHLSNIGIGLLQGYFLYRPMQRSEATRWLASRPEVASQGLPS